MLNYGMSVKSLSERLDESIEEAQKVIDGYYGGLKGVDKFTKDSQQMLKKYGYITDIYGRRRHIPDGALEEYEITSIKPQELFNPFLNTKDRIDTKTLKLIESYKDKLSKTKWKRDKDLIIEQAKKDGFEIKYNGGFISRAMRQCLNARIQGSAATMTKLAMIMINNDTELKNLNFKLLVTVHDEVFGEVPKEYSDLASKRLSELMIEAAKKMCPNVPWKCDPYVVSRWYLDEFAAEVLEEYKKCNDLDKIKDKYSAIKPEYIEMMCKDEFDCNKYEDI